jgi:type IV pilus assembly protein PilM
MVGIDVGIWSTKIVDLQKKKGIYELRKAYIFPTDRSVVIGKEVEKERLSLFLKHTVQRCKSRSKKVAISLNDENCTVKYTRITQATEEQIEKFCWREIEGDIPFSRGETNIDCKIIDIDEEKRDMGVVVAAARKDLVENLLSIFKKAGLVLTIIDADALALYNIWEANCALENEKNVLIIDIGSKLTKILVIIDSKPRFNKMFYIGGYNITSEIENKFGVDENEAKRMKIRAAEDLSVERKEEILAIAREKVDNLFTEIKSVVDSFYQNAGEYPPPVEKIFLCGGSSGLPFLKDVAKQYFDVSSVEVLNPFSVFVVKGSLEYIEKKTSSFAIAAGLALRQ